MLSSLFKNCLFALQLFLCVVTWPSYAQEFDERRVRSGLKLFRTVLAADRDIHRKRTVDDKLLVLLVYTNAQHNAKTFAEELENLGLGNKKGMIRNMPIKVKVINNKQLVSYREKRVAGVYLTQSLFDDELAKLVQFGIDKHVVVYSPFEGDVDKGVFGGLVIDTRIHPLINIDTMKASKLRIKSFFLKVAKKHES
ncbi:MAG: hypothetical protein HRT35_06765 [Algicola sp.]|nr:hypothetical protein [Algicola sp.]